MSDDDARIKPIGQLLDALKDPTLSAEDIARLERELDQYVQVRDPNAMAVVLDVPPVVFEYMAFAEKLKNRQGTKMPDFEAIRRRKNELDRGQKHLS
jgi:hypothetical protein